MAMHQANRQVKSNRQANVKGNRPDPAANRNWFNKQLIPIILAALILVAAAFINLSPPLSLGLYLVSYLLVGGEIIIHAVKNLFRGQIFDENFLMTIATLGAFAIGERLEGVAVMLLYQIGEYLHSLAVNRSRGSIKSLLDIRPDYAHKKYSDQLITVPPEEIEVGDEIVVKPGERIPLDGIIMEGNSILDTSALTGESMPLEASPGEEIYSGFINNTGVLTIKVTKPFDQSTAAKIIKLVEEAADNKAPTEKFITKFARYYTPVVVFLALALALIPPMVLKNASFGHWGYRSLVFLIISCPCALVISIPLSFFAGIGAAARQGILVKGSNYLDTLTQIGTIAFDKTGTLTQGIFTVTKIEAPHLSPDELLEYAAYAESYSQHPIAASIVAAYGKPIDQSLITNYQETAGHGIQATIKGRSVLLGNSKAMADHNISHPEIDTAGSTVYVAIDQKYAGYVLVEDVIKDDAAAAIARLKDQGVKTFAMLTGDNQTIANNIGRKLGIDHVYAQLLPEDKVKIVEQMLGSTNKLAFVGDGINDAPVLARADVGIAMGGLGADAAIEAADVVLMADDLSQLAKGIEIAKRTRRVAYHNIVLTLGAKILFLLLGALGIANLWEAIFADVGITIIAVLNSTRQQFRK